MVSRTLIGAMAVAVISSVGVTEAHVSLVSGWQGDVLPTATNQTIQVPVAKNSNGTSITGPLVLRFTGLTGTTTALMIPRNQPSPYPPVTLDTSKSSLVSAVSES